MYFTSCLLLLLCAAVQLGQIECASAADLVTELPGLSWTPNFKHYSGYLNGTDQNRLHYWFVESSGNPQKDPVVVWMNGGPGCSSMDGMLTEHGPFRIEKDGKTLSPNPYSWNQVANMIYLESPAGVGFSYNPQKAYQFNDDQVAKLNHVALLHFFEKFPEFKENDFYVSGESYAGVYVPTLVDSILNASDINLKGFIVGNPLSDYKLNDNSLVQFIYYHGIIGDVELDQIYKWCCDGNRSVDCDFTAGAEKSEQCKQEMAAVQAHAWAEGLNPYNMYQPCAHDYTTRFDTERGKFVTGRYVLPYFAWNSLPEDLELMAQVKKGNVVSSPPCTADGPIRTYLNTAAVQKALHIPQIGIQWELCSDQVGSLYQRTYSTMAPQYQRAIAKKMRIEVYNGDVDMACNFLGDEWFVSGLHDQVGSKLHRRRWFVKDAGGFDQVAGYVKDFKHVKLVTIKGAGHMVPTDKPKAALHLFLSYLNDLPL